jgi:hypothetical protein
MVGMSRSRLKRSPAPVNPGVLVGAAFGFIFVAANSDAPMPAAAGAAIKGVGGVAFLAVLLAQLRPGRVGTGDVGRPDLGRTFRVVVAAEVVVGGIGLAGLRLGGEPWQANVAWIAVVVGAHFLALAALWRDIGIFVVGAVMMMVGVAGLVMAAIGTAVAWIPSISGVVSGCTLLAGSLAASVWTPSGIEPAAHEGGGAVPAGCMPMTMAPGLPTRRRSSR